MFQVSPKWWHAELYYSFGYLILHNVISLGRMIIVSKVHILSLFRCLFSLKGSELSVFWLILRFDEFNLFPRSFPFVSVVLILQLVSIFLIIILSLCRFFLTNCLGRCSFSIRAICCVSVQGDQKIVHWRDGNIHFSQVFSLLDVGIPWVLRLSAKLSISRK